MAWIYFNPNPMSNRVGDCTIRALSLALNQDWDSTYLDIVIDVPKGCCFTVSVEYVSGVTDGTTTPTPTINVLDGSLSIDRIA